MSASHTPRVPVPLQLHEKHRRPDAYVAAATVPAPTQQNAVTSLDHGYASPYQALTPQESKPTTSNEKNDYKILITAVAIVLVVLIITIAYMATQTGYFKKKTQPDSQQQTTPPLPSSSQTPQQSTSQNAQQPQQQRQPSRPPQSSHHRHRDTPRTQNKNREEENASSDDDTAAVKLQAMRDRRKMLNNKRHASKKKSSDLDRQRELDFLESVQNDDDDNDANADDADNVDEDNNGVDAGGDDNVVASTQASADVGSIKVSVPQYVKKMAAKYAESDSRFRELTNNTTDIAIPHSLIKDKFDNADFKRWTDTKAFKIRYSEFIKA